MKKYKKILPSLGAALLLAVAATPLLPRTKRAPQADTRTQSVSSEFFEASFGNELQEIDIDSLFKSLDTKFPKTFYLVDEPYTSPSGETTYRKTINFIDEGPLLFFEADTPDLYSGARSDYQREEVAFYLQSALPSEELEKLLTTLVLEALSPQEIENVKIEIENRALIKPPQYSDVKKYEIYSDSSTSFPRPEYNYNFSSSSILRLSTEQEEEADQILEATKANNPPFSQEQNVGLALGVMQREAVFVQSGDRFNGEEITHIGTMGVATCVAVTFYKAGDSGKPSCAAIMHIDSNTLVRESLRSILKRFPDTDNLSVSLLSSGNDGDLARRIAYRLKQAGVEVTSTKLDGSRIYMLNVKDGTIDDAPNKEDLNFGADQKERLGLFRFSIALELSCNDPFETLIQRLPIDAPQLLVSQQGYLR